MKRVMLLMLTCMSGCESSGTLPESFTAASVAMFCIINCPLAVTVADEAAVTDAQPIEHPHLLVDNIRALNDRD